MKDFIHGGIMSVLFVAIIGLGGFALANLAKIFGLWLVLPAFAFIAGGLTNWKFNK